MKSIRLNPDYCRRHLGVAVLMFALAGWFGWDGFVVYPRLPDAELYARIEKAPPKDGTDLKAFKAQKVKSQYGFLLLTFLAGAVVGLRLLAAARMRFEWDESGFVWKGVKRPFSDVRKADRSAWEKKGILVLELEDGRVVLDAWHHLGVKDFEKWYNTKV